MFPHRVSMFWLFYSVFLITEEGLEPFIKYNRHKGTIIH